MYRSGGSFREHVFCFLTLLEMLTELFALQPDLGLPQLSSEPWEFQLNFLLSAAWHSLCIKHKGNVKFTIQTIVAAMG